MFEKVLSIQALIVAEFNCYDESFPTGLRKHRLPR